MICLTAKVPFHLTKRHCNTFRQCFPSPTLANPSGYLLPAVSPPLHRSFALTSMLCSAFDCQFSFGRFCQSTGCFCISRNRQFFSIIWKSLSLLCKQAIYPRASRREIVNSAIASRRSHVARNVCAPANVFACIRQRVLSVFQLGSRLNQHGQCPLELRQMITFSNCRVYVK